VPFLDGFVQGCTRSQDLVVELGWCDDDGWCPDDRAGRIQPGRSDRDACGSDGAPSLSPEFEPFTGRR
jgi:hypothetical protein